LTAQFTETESGKKASNRPELQAALELCRKHQAVLIIAKLDRLARNVHFISGLLESGVDFVAVDQPTKDRFMLHIQAAFAEEEARRISLRTKEALAAAKRRGVVIGATGRLLAARYKDEATRRAKEMAPVILAVRGEGFQTLRELRDELNRLGVPSPGGGRWHLPNLFRTLKRIECRMCG
jgi:DNA invertase Pin-like site-specific DNA recombinase